MNSIVTLSKSECVGCRSCLQICPKNAISMQEDYEGFYYPVISDKCIDCGICRKHCPVLVNPKQNLFNQEYVGLVLRDKIILEKSSSGGVFAGIAKFFLADSGYVFGCRFSENLEAEHVGINSLDLLKDLQGSKYVASNTKETYAQVKAILKDGKRVLYSGTPCQIAGLYAFLGKDFENLYTIDLICHGTPSQKLFSKYIAWLGKHYHDKIIYYGFRDKDVGGWSCGGKFKTKTKTKTKTNEAVCDPYYASFLRGETYRESCYSCRFANMNRVGDLSIGDFWGIEKRFPQFVSKDGVSICLINSQKGKILFEQIKNKFEFFNCEQIDFLDYNHNLLHPTVRPIIRDNIYKEVFESNEFKTIAHKNIWIFKIKSLISALIPPLVKKIMKRGIKK